MFPLQASLPSTPPPHTHQTQNYGIHHLASETYSRNVPALLKKTHLMSPAMYLGYSLIHQYLLFCGYKKFL